MKEQLAALITTALDTLASQGELPAGPRPEFTIERTRDPSHGDLASNVALVLSKAAGRKPRVPDPKPRDPRVPPFVILELSYDLNPCPNLEAAPRAIRRNGHGLAGFGGSQASPIP